MQDSFASLGHKIRLNIYFVTGKKYGLWVCIINILQSHRLCFMVQCEKYARSGSSLYSNVMFLYTQLKVCGVQKLQHQQNYKV